MGTSSSLRRRADYEQYLGNSVTKVLPGHPCYCPLTERHAGHEFSYRYLGKNGEAKETEWTGGYYCDGNELMFGPENRCWRWPDGSIFEGYPCMDCGRPVHDWAAGHNEWAEVIGDPEAGHICADCFIIRADAKGVHLCLVRY
jgi:hypothetical protein